MRRLAFYIAKGIKRQCKTYVLALFRKESSEQEAKQRLHKFYFEQKHIQNHNDTLHHKTAIMLTPHTTEPDCRRTEAGTETNIKTHGRKDCQITQHQAIRCTATCHNIHAKHDTDMTQHTTKRQVWRSQSRKGPAKPGETHFKRQNTMHCPHLLS